MYLNSSLLFHSLVPISIWNKFELPFENTCLFMDGRQWEVTLRNIKYIHHMYGLSNAQRHRYLIG